MNSTVMSAQSATPNNKIKRSAGENIGTFLIYLIVFLFAVMCILPFVLVIIVSFSSEKSITVNGYSFWPAEWSLEAYRMLFLPSSSVPQAYLVTGIATVFGTIVASFITFGAGYTLEITSHPGIGTVVHYVLPVITSIEEEDHEKSADRGR